MSTSLLYHGWGLKDYRYIKTEYTRRTVHFHVERKPKSRSCSACGSTDVILKGRRQRAFRATPIGTRRVLIVVHLHRHQCRSCGRVRLEPLSLADPKKTFTRHLGRHVLELCRKATISDVAELTGLPWDTICEILRKDLEARKKRIDWHNLKYIAIDEVSVGKGQNNYLTVVLNLETGRAVHVVQTRRKAALASFFKRLRRSGTRLLAVAMDMHEPFRLAIIEYYKWPVAIVFDHFHVIKLFNEVLDDIRRDEVRRVEDKEGKKLIKGSRYLLLWASENLKADGKKKLDALLAVNETLNTAYVLKEALRACWYTNNRAAAEAALNDWVAQARSSDIARLEKFANTLVKHWEGILAFFDHPISTGKLEAFNNKIGVLKRKAYGYRNKNLLMLRILFLHECKRQLTGF